MHIQRNPETGDIILSNENYTDNFCVFNEDIATLSQALNIALNLDELAAIEARQQAQELFNND